MMCSAGDGNRQRYLISFRGGCWARRKGCGSGVSTGALHPGDGSAFNFAAVWAGGDLDCRVVAVAQISEAFVVPGSWAAKSAAGSVLLGSMLQCLLSVLLVPISESCFLYLILTECAREQRQLQDKLITLSDWERGQCGGEGRAELGEATKDAVVAQGEKNLSSGSSPFPSSFEAEYEELCRRINRPFTSAHVTQQLSHGQRLFPRCSRSSGFPVAI
ncbi:hypothetical protein CIB84_017434 [Bambusicola thoracicus]|uniref:Uncharacterized protein n=1 Tax=Bambusicola thoracicus TaxID=9083 RepID=A0A2P4S402_BAMTH|nr:hypothetical protein CIB84_017434 [Bambusicola thoracicus]